MKEKIKKVVTPIFLSVLCGFVCGRVMFSIYEDKSSNILGSNIIYLLEDATYDNYNNMKTNTISSNYIYYEEEGKYTRVVAMSKNKDNIEKIKNVYDGELIVSEYLLNNEEVNSKLDEYDRRINTASSDEEIKNIIVEMINMYKEDNVKMVKIS